MGVISKFLRKISNKGFTLIEALIATVLVGACIMPIVGTMQNAESMTQRMVNDNKLQMLARSRMNLETSRANNEQKYIDETTGWLYEWYENDGDKFPRSVATYSTPNEFSTATSFSITNMFRVYRIAVKVKDNVILKSEKSDGTMENDADFKGLKQVVVTSQIVGEDGQFYILEDNSLTDNNYPTGNEKYKVDEKYLAEMGSISLNPPPDYVQQYSLVSLVTVPEVSSEYVYALDIKNNAVCSFDPVTGMMSKKYKLPGDKLYQAVFPSPDGKKLFLFGGNTSSVTNSGLFDIDPSSATYAQFIKEKGTINRTGNGSSLNRENALYKTKYVLRPDGNRAYAIQLQTSGSDYVIKGYYNSDLNGNWNITDVAYWFSASEDFGISYDTATLFLTAGSDGFLYFGPFDDNSIKRHPMYNNTPLNLKFVETAKLPSSVPSVTDYSPNMRPVAVCVSPDSYVVYALYKLSDNKKYYIAVFDSLTFQFKRIIKILDSVNPVLITDMNISADGRFVTLVCVNNNAKRMVYILKTSLIESGSPINNYKAEFDDTIACYNAEYAIYSKLTGHFIVDNADKPILRSIDYNDILENSPTSGSTATVTHSIAQADSSSIITHHSVRTPEIIYTTSKDNNGKFTLKAIDTGLKEFNEEFEINLKWDQVYRTVALSPNGDSISEFYKESSPGIPSEHRYNHDTFLCEKTTDIDLNYVDVNTKSKFLSKKLSSGKYPVVLYNTGDKYQLEENSGFREFDLNSDWHIKKVIGTNSGGAIILASNNANYSSNKKSLVDWYELKEDKTGFERCGRWVSEGTSLNHFPPYNAIDMAISRDDRVLVFISEALDGSEYKYYANFFDFGTYNFGNKTQMQGMIIDLRDEDRNLNLTSVNPANGKIKASDDGGYTLLDNFTNTYIDAPSKLTNLFKNPIKFDESSMPSNIEIASETKIISGKNKRIFGYYNKINDKDGSLLNVTIASFSPNFSDTLGRAWINNQVFRDNNLVASSSETVTETNSNTYLIQLDQTASSKIRVDKYCAVRDNNLENDGWNLLDSSNIEGCSDLQNTNYTSYGNSSREIDNSYNSDIGKFIGNDDNTFINNVKNILCEHTYQRVTDSSGNLAARPGMYFTFSEEVPNGIVGIDLLFCERAYGDPSSPHYNKPNRRFSVRAEEKKINDLDDFYPFNVGGYKIPIIASDCVNISDGEINLRFTDKETTTGVQETSFISAIKLKYYDSREGDEVDKYGFNEQQISIFTTSSNNIRQSEHVAGDGTGAIETTDVRNRPSWAISDWPFRATYMSNNGNNMEFIIPWRTGMSSARATVYFMEHMAANNTVGSRVLKLSSSNSSTSYNIDFIKDANNKSPGWIFNKTLILQPISSNKLKIKFDKISGDIPSFSGIKIDWYYSENGAGLASASISLKKYPSTYIDIAATETMPLKFEPFWIGSYTNILRKNNSNVVNFEASRFVEDDGYFYLCSSSTDGSYIKKFTLNDTADLNANQVEEKNCIQNMILSENKPYIYFNYLDGTNNNIYAIKDSLSSSDCEKIATDTDNKANRVTLLNKPYNRMKKSIATNTLVVTDTYPNGIQFPEGHFGCNKAVAVNGAIYYVGGDGVSGSDFRKIYKFDPLDKTITNKATFNNNIRNASVAAYDNIIYVFNGSLDSLETNVCAYDVKNDKKIEYVAGGTNVVESEEKLIFPLTNVSSTKINQSKFNIADSNGITVIEALGDDQADNKQESNVSCLFDNNDSTYWLSDGHVTAGVYRSCNKNHYLKFEFPKSFTLKWIELTSKNEDGTIYGVYDWQSHYPTKFKISTSEGGLDLLSGNGVLSSECLNQRFYTSIDAESNTYYFEIPKGEHGSGNSYPWISIHELRFFGTEKKQIPTPSTLGMSPITDDTLNKITASSGCGVCITPYGIMRAGGEGTGSSTSQIYWPHAMADYDNERSGNKGTRGLCHSLADIASQTIDANNWYFKDMSLVYHKGKVYGFGMAKPGVGVEQPKAISYDFDRNEWSYFYISALNRSYAAAVSFGDEIYLFGGIKFSAVGGTPSYPKDGSIIAWNPEKNTVRECGTIGNISSAGVPLSHISACAYGSDIYLFGGLDNEGNPTKKIYKFTP